MTGEYIDLDDCVEISIHIPRVGDDTIIAAIGCGDAHFNPHPPCGG